MKVINTIYDKISQCENRIKELWDELVNELNGRVHKYFPSVYFRLSNIEIQLYRKNDIEDKYLVNFSDVDEKNYTDMGEWVETYFSNININIFSTEMMIVRDKDEDEFKKLWKNTFEEGGEVK